MTVRYKPYTPPMTRTGRGVSVTGYDGRANIFSTIEEGIAYAMTLYASAPARPLYRKPDTRPARWGNAPSPITWHVQRHKFSKGRVKAVASP